MPTGGCAVSDLSHQITPRMWNQPCASSLPSETKMKCFPKGCPRMSRRVKNKKAMGLPWWFRGWLCASNAGGPGSIPSQGTKSHTPCRMATPSPQKRKKAMVVILLSLVSKARITWEKKWWFLTASLRTEARGFHGGSLVKGLPASVGDTGLIPDLGRSHMPRSNWAHVLQLPSLCSRAWEPQLLSPNATARE